MKQLLPEVTIIDFSNPSADKVTGIFAGAEEGLHPLLLTGEDALNWYSTAIWSKDLLFAVWPSPDTPIVIYAGDNTEDVRERLDSGTLVIVSGGGLGPDVPFVVKNRVTTGSEIKEFFGLDNVVISSENPVQAAIRRLGNPNETVENLRIIGATVTIFAGHDSVVAKVLAGHVKSSLTLKNVKRESPSIISKVSWSRALGTFQLIYTDTINEKVNDASAGPTAAIVPDQDLGTHIDAILSHETETYDVVAAAEPGGITSSVTDLSAFSDVGYVILTGETVPQRPVLVLHGEASMNIRGNLEDHVLTQEDSKIYVGPPEHEDHERFKAHQWVSQMHRAEDARSEDYNHGGPSLISEAKSIGLIDHTKSSTRYESTMIEDELREANIVDTATLISIAISRGWHLIDPLYPPVLDTILSEARLQIAGDEDSITVDYMSKLKTWSQSPGFWSTLPTAFIETSGALIFPYPPVAVDLLRAVNAADGDAVELRRLIGPIKVALLSALGSKPENDGGVSNE